MSIKKMGNLVAFRLPKELHKEMKKNCLKKGISVSCFLRQLIEHSIKKKHSKEFIDYENEEKLVDMPIVRTIKVKFNRPVPLEPLKEEGQ